MKSCPKCGSSDIDQHTINIGVGVIEGPWGCVECGWSEYPEYDLSDGRSPFDEKGGVTDQFGAYYPPGNSVALAYSMAQQADAAAALKELDVVELLPGVNTTENGEVLNGVLIPQHAQGTIVYCWPHGLIEVEFTDPQVVVTLSRHSVKLVQSYGIPENTKETGV